MPSLERQNLANRDKIYCSAKTTEESIAPVIIDVYLE